MELADEQSDQCCHHPLRPRPQCGGLAGRAVVPFCC